MSGSASMTDSEGLRVRTDGSLTLKLSRNGQSRGWSTKKWVKKLTRIIIVKAVLELGVIKHRSRQIVICK